MIQLYCGDNVTVIREKIQDESVDLTVTSPPYGSMRDYKGYSWDFESLAKELFRVTKPGGVVVWVVGDETVKGSETLDSFRQALFFKEIGFSVETMIYEKSNFSFPANNRYHQIFEYMFVLSKGSYKTFNGIKDRPNTYVGQKPHGKMRTKDGGWESVKSSYKLKKEGIAEFGLRHNIWRYVTGGGNVTKDKIAYQHPAIFPEKLAHDHIVSWSNPGDLVLDQFLGSGTTGKEAKILGRNFIGIDIAQEYVDLARQRIDSVMF